MLKYIFKKLGYGLLVLIGVAAAAAVTRVPATRARLMGLDAAMLRATECRVEDLAAVIAEQTRLSDYPLADRVEEVALFALGVFVQHQFDAIERLQRCRDTGYATNCEELFLGDMGITSRHFAHETCTPAQKDCLAAPSGQSGKEGASVQGQPTLAM